MNTQRRFEIYQATPNLVSRKHKTPGMTAGTSPPSPVPTQKNTPVHLRIGVSKGGPQPPFGRFKGVPGGNSKSPRESFLGSAKGYSFDSKRISPRKPPIFIADSPRPSGVAHPAPSGAKPAGPRPLSALPARRGREQKPPSILGTPWPVGQPPRRDRKPPGFPRHPPTGRLASAEPKKRAAIGGSLFPQTLFRS